MFSAYFRVTLRVTFDDDQQVLRSGTWWLFKMLIINLATVCIYSRVVCMALLASFFLPSASLIIMNMYSTVPRKF